MEQIKHQRCKAVVGILNASQSKQLIKWRHLVRLIFYKRMIDGFVYIFICPIAIAYSMGKNYTRSSAVADKPRDTSQIQSAAFEKACKRRESVCLYVHRWKISELFYQNGSAFLMLAYPGCPGKRPLNECSSSSVEIWSKMWGQHH